MQMEVDCKVPDSLGAVTIVMPNGTKREMDISQIGNLTVADLFKSCVEDGENVDDYAFVFFGRKLKPDQQVKVIPHLNANRPLRLVKQKNSQKTIQNKEEIDKLLKECRFTYKQLIENAHPQISGEAYQMLLNYFMENKGENYAKAVKEFPILAYDQLGQSIVRDSRLLVPYVMENDQFAYEHPHCVQIFKKALDAVSLRFSPSSSMMRFPPGLLPLPGQPGAGPSRQRDGAPGEATPRITQQQLSNALAMAFGGLPPAPPTPAEQPTTGQQQPQPPAEPRPEQVLQGAAQTFAEQLQQLHDFGFTDDAENIQALMLTDGDVQRALEIVIAMRE